jgi:hypothetical protein
MAYDNPYKQQLQKLRGRLNDPANANRIPRIQQRINSVREQAGKDPRDWTNWKPKNQATPATPAAAAPVDTTPNPFSDDYWKTLMPAPTAVTAAEPTNLQGSPAYQWALKQAQDQLDKRLSATGHSPTSGIALQASSDMTNDLLAQEVDRQQKVAEWKAAVATGNADRTAGYDQAGASRLWDILSSQITRGDALKNEDFDRKMAILNFLAGQNPMPYVASSVNESAQLKSQLAKYAADYMSQMYPQIFQIIPDMIPPFYEPGAAGAESAATKALKGE